MSGPKVGLWPRLIARGPQVGRAGDAEGARVHAREREEGATGVDVGGAGAELAAAAGAVHDLAFHCVPAAELVGGALELAGRHGGADVRAAHLAVATHEGIDDEVDDDHGDAGGAQELGEFVDAAAAAGAEAEVGADDDGRGAEAGDEEALGERGG